MDVLETLVWVKQKKTNIFLPGLWSFLQIARITRKAHGTVCAGPMKGVSDYFRYCGRDLDAHRRCLRRHGFHLPRVSSLHGRDRICPVVRLQPLQVDDGALRLHSHVVGSARASPECEAVFHSSDAFKQNLCVHGCMWALKMHFHCTQDIVSTSLQCRLNLQGEEQRGSASDVQCESAVPEARKHRSEPRLIIQTLLTTIPGENTAFLINDDSRRDFTNLLTLPVTGAAIDYMVTCCPKFQGAHFAGGGKVTFQRVLRNFVHLLMNAHAKGTAAWASSSLVPSCVLEACRCRKYHSEQVICSTCICILYTCKCSTKNNAT